MEIKCPHGHIIEASKKLGVTVYKHKGTDESCNMLNTKNLSLDRLSSTTIKHTNPDVCSRYVIATFTTKATAEYVVEKIVNEPKIETVVGWLIKLDSAEVITIDFMDLLQKKIGNNVKTLFGAAGLLYATQRRASYSTHLAEGYRNFFVAYAEGQVLPKCLGGISDSDIDSLRQGRVSEGAGELTAELDIVCRELEQVSVTAEQFEKAVESASKEITKVKPESIWARISANTEEMQFE